MSRSPINTRGPKLPCNKKSRTEPFGSCPVKSPTHTTRRTTHVEALGSYLSCSGNWEPRALNVNAGTYHPLRSRRWHATFQKLLCFELYRIDQPNIATTKNSAIIGMQLTPELSTIALENVAARTGLILDEPHFQTQTSLLCPATMLHHRTNPR